MIQETNFIWHYLDSESGLICPWYVLPCLQWLKAQNTKQWVVFEYGAGYSTCWWRANANQIFSVESNLEWAKAMGPDVMFEDVESLYVKSIEEVPSTEFDCIIIDGKWREECLKFCVEYCTPRYIIIDNYGQEDFPQDAVDRTEELLKDWTKVVHKQPNHSTWRTAVFTKP